MTDRGTRARWTTAARALSLISPTPSVLITFFAHLPNRGLVPPTGRARAVGERAGNRNPPPPFPAGVDHRDAVEPTADPRGRLGTEATRI